MALTAGTRLGAYEVLALLGAGGQFYPAPSADFNPLNGFLALKRRWTLNDAERVRSGIDLT